MATLSALSPTEESWTAAVTPSHLQNRMPLSGLHVAMAISVSRWRFCAALLCAWHVTQPCKDAGSRSTQHGTLMANLTSCFGVAAPQDCTPPYTSQGAVLLSHPLPIHRLHPVQHTQGIKLGQHPKHQDFGCRNAILQNSQCLPCQIPPGQQASAAEPHWQRGW